MKYANPPNAWNPNGGDNKKYTLIITQLGDPSLGKLSSSTDSDYLNSA
jgi:hypothetical protein